MNTVNLIGRWVADVDLKYTNSGKAVATGRLAVKDGDAAYFFTVVIWEKQAESVSNHCGAKGRQVGISGKLTQRQYEHDGQKRSVVEVVAHRVDFLGDSGNSNNQGSGTRPSGGMGSELTFDSDDDVPF